MNNAMSKMAPTTQRPASANFATQQQRVRRIGSFVSSNNSIDKTRYPDRVPVRLFFKHEKLENIAQQNLKSRTVMAMSNLTVNEFKIEVLNAMNAMSHRIRKSQIDIAFSSKSVKFPIHFQDYEYLEKVFKKICAIEESREISSRHSSNEDKNRHQNRVPHANARNERSNSSGDQNLNDSQQAVAQ